MKLHFSFFTFYFFRIGLCRFLFFWNGKKIYKNQIHYDPTKDDLPHKTTSPDVSQIIFFFFFFILPFHNNSVCA